MILLYFLPLYGILFTANLDAAGRVWRSITYGFIVSVSSFIVCAGVGLLVGGSPMLQQLVADPGAFAGVNTLVPSLFLTLAGVAGVAMMVPAVRARVIEGLRLRLDPENTVHMVALVFAVWLAGLVLAQLFIFMRLPVETVTEGATVTVAQLWEQGIAFTLFALLGVGLGLRRGLAETLERLGVTRMTRRQVAIAIGAILALSAFDLLVTLVWQAVAPLSLERVSAISEALFADVIGPLGAITIGLTAGIGEELLFRGAVQPRFGLVLTTILFTLGHVQYELSPALFSVFVIGLVLGLVRQRENTTTAILIHAGYNALNVLLAPLWS